MKKLLSLCAALTMIFATLSASAATATDLTGAWTGQFISADGSIVLDISCTLKQEGTKLTGSFDNSQGGDPIVITDGKIDGDKVTFKLTVNGMLITHQGTITGDDIKLNSTSDSEGFPGGVMTLKRTKPATPAPVPATTPAPAN